MVVEDMIMAGPFRGFRKADVDSLNLTDELKKQLLNKSNEDTFMRRILDRREQSMKDRERRKVRQEEREKTLAEAKLEVAEEVREEVKAEALVELKPELESLEVLKQRARYEVMAELQGERKGIDEERASVERERERIREEEQANVRREMMVNMINGGDVSVGGVPGGGSGVAVAERPAVAAGDGGGRRVNGDGKVPGYGAGPVGGADDGSDYGLDDALDDGRGEIDEDGHEEIVSRMGRGLWPLTRGSSVSMTGRTKRSVWEVVLVRATPPWKPMLS